MEKNAIMVYALAGMALGCTVEASENPVPSAEVKLSASYGKDFGFAFDSASAARLPALLESGESLNVIIRGQSEDVRSIAWGDVLATDAGPFRLEAVAGPRSRSLGELEVGAETTPQCDASPELPAEDAATTPATPETLGTTTQALAAACSHGYYSWYCINCQCRSGIAVRGYSRRYICIYGALYPENVYRCNCNFTARICGVTT